MLSVVLPQRSLQHQLPNSSLSLLPRVPFHSQFSIQQPRWPFKNVIRSRLSSAQNSQIPSHWTKNKIWTLYHGPQSLPDLFLPRTPVSKCGGGRSWTDKSHPAGSHRVLQQGALGVWGWLLRGCGWGYGRAGTAVATILEGTEKGICVLIKVRKDFSEQVTVMEPRYERWLCINWVKEGWHSWSERREQHVQSPRNGREWSAREPLAGNCGCSRIWNDAAETGGVLFTQGLSGHVKGCSLS